MRRLGWAGLVALLVAVGPSVARAGADVPPPQGGTVSYSARNYISYHGFSETYYDVTLQGTLQIAPGVTVNDTFTMNPLKVSQQLPWPGGSCSPPFATSGCPVVGDSGTRWLDGSAPLSGSKGLQAVCSATGSPDPQSVGIFDDFRLTCTDAQNDTFPLDILLAPYQPPAPGLGVFH